MRALNAIPLAIAMFLCAAPAFAQPAGKPPAAAPGKAHAKGKANARHASKKEARVLEALKRAGIDEARAKQVIAVVKKYREERQPVRKEMQTHKRTLRALLSSNSSDQAAYTKALDGLKAGKKKLQEIEDRQVAEIQQILAPSEQAKVLRLLQRAKHRRAHA
jgi:Spy/CpxP family protein refolding chaperone